MKKFFWRKVPLVIVPTALIATPLLTFLVSKNNFYDYKPNDANFQQEIEKIIHNQNFSLQEKINQLQDKLKKLGNHTLDILNNLNSELDNLKHLKECQKYLTNLNWETNLSNTLPSKFSKQKNQLFDLKLLKLKTNPKFTNVDFEYKLIGINDNEGTLTIEIKFKYQVKYMSTIQQTIHGFKKYTETNNDFQNMAGFLAALQNITNQNTVGLFPKEDKISALITEIYNIFPNSKKYLTLKVTNENTKISDFIDKDTNIIKLSLELIDDKTKKSQQFKNVNFKITNHTIYLNSNNQKQITFDHDLSEINTKEIIRIGYYKVSDNEIRAVKMPKTVEKVPKDLPKQITSLKKMFENCVNFNQDLSKWDTSKITDMSYMFRAAKKFNGNISSWNTSQVTNMEYMFADYFYGINFNQDISSWDVSNVTNMGRMFFHNSIFNQDISKWDTSNVTDMYGLFQDAEKFNKDISKWNVSNVTNMRLMFFETKAFNQDISKWNTSNVKDMSSMFLDAQSFNNGDKTGQSNKPLSWNVSNVTDMSYMFAGAKAFNQDISKWNTNNVTKMKSMFENAKLFNQDLFNWNVAEVTDYENFAKNSGFENNVAKQPDFPNNQPATIYLDQNGEKQVTFKHDLSDYNIKEILKIGFYQESQGVFRVARMPKTVEKVPDKLPSKITSLEDMFKDCANFNQDLSSWNVSNVTNMSVMFAKASNFNQDLSSWNVSNVTNMSNMFWEAKKFNNGDETGQSNKPLTWNVSNVTNMYRMFLSAKAFNQNISKWNTSNVINMKDMFENASAFNQDLSKWNVDKVTHYDDFSTKSGFANEPNKWPVKFRRKKNYLL